MNKKTLWETVLIVAVLFGVSISAAGDDFYVIAAGSGSWSKSDSNIYYNEGNVGIGTSIPAYPLHIKKNHHGGWIAGLHNTGTAGNDYGLIVRADGGDPLLIQGYLGANFLRVESDGDVGIGEDNPGYKLTVNGTAWCTSGSWTGSDRRWKKDMEPIKDPLQKVLRLRGVTYHYNRKEYKQMGFPKDRQMGMIAQEVEKEFPECVTTNPEGYKAIDYGKFSAVLLESIKRQQTIIEEQNTRLQVLEKKLASF